MTRAIYLKVKLANNYCLFQEYSVLGTGIPDLFYNLELAFKETFKGGFLFDLEHVRVKQISYIVIDPESKEILTHCGMDKCYLDLLLMMFKDTSEEHTEEHEKLLYDKFLESTNDVLYKVQSDLEKKKEQDRIEAMERGRALALKLEDIKESEDYKTYLEVKAILDSITKGT